MDADNVSPSVSRTRKRQSLAAGSGQAPEAYDEDASNKEKDIKRLQCLINQKTPACLWWWLLWLILMLVILMIMMMACHVHIWCTFAIILIHYDEGTGKEEAIDKAWRRKNDDNDGKKDDSFANPLIFPNRNHASISWWAMLQEKGQQTEWPKMYVHPTVGHCGKMMSYLSSGTVL